MEGKSSRKLKRLRIRSPRAALIPTFPIQHLSTPFLAKSPFPSKGGPGNFTSNRRSLNIPPATAASELLRPGSPRDFGFLRDPTSWRVWALSPLNDKPKRNDSYFGTGGFFPGRGLLLSCLSMVGGRGGFCILDEWSPRGLRG